MSRPEHYRQLPKGVRCKCPALWQEIEPTGRLSYWCCNPAWLEEAEHERHEQETRALAASNGQDFT